jgi:hypothetical protein
MGWLVARIVEFKNDYKILAWKSEVLADPGGRAV